MLNLFEDGNGMGDTPIGKEVVRAGKGAGGKGREGSPNAKDENPEQGGFVLQIAERFAGEARFFGTRKCAGIKAMFMGIGIAGLSPGGLFNPGRWGEGLFFFWIVLRDWVEQFLPLLIGLGLPGIDGGAGLDVIGELRDGEGDGVQGIELLAEGEGDGGLIQEGICGRGDDEAQEFDLILHAAGEFMVESVAFCGEEAAGIEAVLAGVVVAGGGASFVPGLFLHGEPRGRKLRRYDLQRLGHPVPVGIIEQLF